MNYHNKKIAITGANGFLGKEIIEGLQFNGAEVVEILGDIRNPRTFDVLDHTFDYLFHFAAPSSQTLFQRMPSHCIQVTVKGFMNAADAAKRHGVRLVYPSTGLLSSDQKPNEYALCKRICELYAAGKNMDAIGLRIFATYGPGEDHKRDYASVPFLFARDMVNKRRPLIFGDGNQVRDFIYIADVREAILCLAEECSDPIVDIGSGLQTSFNTIVHLINAQLDTAIDAVFVDRPGGYVQETVAKPARMLEFYTPTISFEQGLHYMVESLMRDKGGNSNG